MNEIIKLKLGQAQEALEEAKALLSAGAELNFVMNSLYYAFLYPVLGLLQARNINVSLQSAAIAMFEQEFVVTRKFDQRFMDAIRRSFELKPSCVCQEQKHATRRDIDQLLPIAQEFLEQIRRVAESVQATR